MKQKDITHKLPKLNDRYWTSFAIKNRSDAEKYLNYINDDKYDKWIGRIRIGFAFVIGFVLAWLVLK
jgi:hypothetical protein